MIYKHYYIVTIFFSHIIPLQQRKEMACSKPAVCMTCLNTDKTTKPAEFRCIDCLSNYCENCYEKHRKASKTHQFQTLLSNKMDHKTTSKKEIICEHCEQFESECFCTLCDHVYCLECKESHKRYHFPNKSLQKHSDALKLCFTCKQYGGLSISENFCVGCKSQFCFECCQVHECSNVTGKCGFTIKSPFCEPCDAMTIVTNGTCICLDCNEFMCDSCWRQHAALKMMNKHKMKKVQVFGKLMKNILLCGPCKQNEKEEKALYKCIECDTELLCRECAVQHMTFKKTIDHRVTELPTQPKHLHSYGTQTQR